MIKYFDNQFVHNFLLNINQPFLANVWEEQMISDSTTDRTEYMKTAHWFKRNFTSNGDVAFSQLETTVRNGN